MGNFEVLRGWNTKLRTRTLNTWLLYLRTSAVTFACLRVLSTRQQGVLAQTPPPIILLLRANTDYFFVWGAQ